MGIKGKQRLSCHNQNMMISVTVMDETLASVFEYHTEIHPLRIMILAESREAEARRRGVEWTINRINYAGKYLVDTVKTSHTRTLDLQKEVTDIVMALWLHQSIFMDFKTKSFMKANLELRILSDGTVQSISHPIEE